MALPTLLDIAARNGSDTVTGLIDETIASYPEVSRAYARTIKGRFYKTLVRTALPSAGFRDANQGVTATKSQHENRIVETFILNPRWECDKAVADNAEDGPQAYIAEEGEAMVGAALKTMAFQFYYGRTQWVISSITYGGDPKGPYGLLASYDAANMTIDAGGTTANTATSVWAVTFGPKYVGWVWGENGALELADVRIADLTDPEGKRFTGYVEEILAYPGLQLGNIKAVARIKKLTEDSGKTLTDTLLAQLLNKFPVGIKPDAIFMNRRSLAQLQASRTAVTLTGAQAPTPTEAFGVPIVPTDAILNNETLAL